MPTPPLREQYRTPSPDEYASLAFHPYNVLLVLTVFSLSMLFLALTAAFVYTRFQTGTPPLQLPILFLFNTAVLIGSSYTMLLAKRAYRDDDTEGYKKALGMTIVLSLLFLCLQIIAWFQLFQQDIFINSSNAAGYLYVISALHFLHLIAGIPFLCWFLWQAHNQMKEPVSVLVYFSDPERRLKLRLLGMYWHFLDILWIYLVLFFFVNQLIH